MKGGDALILTREGQKRLAILAEEVERVELTDEDKRRFDDLERELLSLDLDYLLQ